MGGTHHDPQSFEDVEFTHGARTVLVEPGVHTHLVEDMPGTDTGRKSEGPRGGDRGGGEGQSVEAEGERRGGCRGRKGESECRRRAGGGVR